jgi:hypothetical protein
MIFLPNDDALEARSKAILEEVLAKEGLELLGYRAVPVRHEVVGRFAKATQPRFAQVRGPRRRGGGGGRGGAGGGDLRWRGAARGSRRRAFLRREHSAGRRRWQGCILRGH